MPRFAQYFHLPHYHIDTGGDLKLIYAIRILADIIDKLSLFFLPIFLFQQGYSGSLVLQQGWSPSLNGLVIMAFYYTLMRFTVFVSTFAVGKLVGYSVRFSLVLSHICRALCFVALIAAQQNPWFALLAAVPLGLHINLFWLSFHYGVSGHALKSHLAQDLGFVNFLIQITHMAIPFISGFISALYGFSAVFFLGLAGMGLGLVLSLGIRHGQRTRISSKDYRSVVKSMGIGPGIISIGGRYMYEAMMVLWPLYIFLQLGKLEQVGLIYSASYVIAMIFPLAVGLYIDHNKKRSSFLLSGSMLSAAWAGRLLFTSPFAYVAIDAFERLVANFHWIYYDTLIYRWGKKTRSLAFFVIRELIVSGFAVVFWLTIATIFWFTQGSWQILFILAAIGALASTYIVIW